MHRRLVVAAVLLMSGAALAADMLPLKQGIYVPLGRACKGASNADIVNYWGGDSSIGASGGTCTITKLSRDGTVFTIHDRCKDLGGQPIVGGPTVLKIASPTRFTVAGTAYRYCGTKVAF